MPILLWIRKIEGIIRLNIFKEKYKRERFGRKSAVLSEDMREDLVRGLISIFHNNISMIILYGSVARNEATDESDIDVAIIVKNQMDDDTKRQFVSWTADMDIRYERVFSIVDIQESNMMKWEKVLPFYQNIRKEGIVLWKAA